MLMASPVTTVPNVCLSSASFLMKKMKKTFYSIYSMVTDNHMRQVHPLRKGGIVMLPEKRDLPMKKWIEALDGHIFLHS